MKYSRFSFILSLFAVVANGINITLPTPNGTYGTQISILELTDTSRIDPWSPTHDYRRIMTSTFYPVMPANQCEYSTVHYMPPTTAALEDQTYAQYGIANGTFSAFQLPVCNPPNGKQFDRCTTDFPLVIFSPGLGNSRLFYNAIAQSLASEGFVVITIDHPYDADIVEFTDGSFVLAANISSVEQIDDALKVRVADVSFLLDYLSNHSSQHSSSDHQFPYIHLNSPKVFGFGHSLGGATSASALLHDPRIQCGVNLDGTFFGELVSNKSSESLNIKKPFMLFGHEGKNFSTDSSWEVMWSERLKGPKLDYQLEGSQHGTFTDLPMLAGLLGFDLTQPSPLTEVLGSLKGSRVIDILTAYLVAFFNFVGGIDDHEKGYTPSPLLKGPVESFPEVQFVAEDGV